MEDIALQVIEDEYLESDLVTTNTRITADMICRMHRDWLENIYEWAGSYRTVDMSKGGFSFPPAWLIPQNMAHFEQDVLTKHTPCRGKTVEDISWSLAVVHADLLLIHPFREGNGRLARWLADIMAAQAGLPLPDYGFIGEDSDKQKEDYLQAVIKGYGQDYEPLACFFAAAFKRRKRQM